MGLTIVTPAGAVARDHLSNERTMLAYLRTSMAFLSLGIAVIKLAKYAIINPLQDLNLDEYPKILRHDLYIASKYSKPLGILSLVACLVALGCGIVRFWTMHKRLIKSRPFSSGTIPALLISLSILPLGAVLVENKGQVARDHLASERTFLAWLRTSLTFASVGVYVSQMLAMGETPSSAQSDTRIGKALGLCFMVMAIFSLVMGCARFFIAQAMLRHSRFPAIKWEAVVVYGVTFVLSVALFGKVHGSLARAGKVKSQTPKVDKTEKPKQPKGRAYKRLQYTKRFVNVANTIGGKRRMNPGPSSR